MNNSQKLRKKYPMMNMRMGEKLTLKEKETADMLIEYVVEMDKKLKEALIKELRSKNPYANNDIIQSLERFQGYDFCCDMLEKNVILLVLWISNRTKS